MQQAPPTRWSQVKMWSGLAALVALGIFFAQNLQDVEIHFLWWTRDLPMILALALSAAAGAVVMWGLTTLRRRSAASAARAAGQQPGAGAPQKM